MKLYQFPFWKKPGWQIAVCRLTALFLAGVIYLAAGCGGGAAVAVDSGPGLDPSPDRAPVPDASMDRAVPDLGEDAYAGDLPCGTRLASVTSQGTPFQTGAVWPSISRDGTTVVFNVVSISNDPTSFYQVYAHDLVTGMTELISVGTDGKPANHNAYLGQQAVSRDGRFVAFSTKATNFGTPAGYQSQLYLRDRKKKITKLISKTPAGAPANGSNSRATISDDGSVIAFSSMATDLDTRDTGYHTDLYVWSRKPGKIVWASAPDGANKPRGAASGHHWLSGNGQRAAFVDRDGKAWVRDLSAGKTMLVGKDETGRIVACNYPSISGDGKQVVYQVKNGAYDDVYLAEPDTGKVKRISLVASGDPKVHPGKCWDPAISGNGRYVVYTSASPLIVPGDTNSSHDIFRVDLDTGKTERVSVAHDGKQGLPGGNIWPGLQAKVADSGRVVFTAYFLNLTPHKLKGGINVFIRPGCM